MTIELMPKELVKHQQDMIQDCRGVARTICPGTHDSGSHLTKTLVIMGVDPYNGAMTGDVEPTLGINCGISTGRNGVYECETDSDE